MGKYRLSFLVVTCFFSFCSSVFYLPHCYAEILHGTPQDDTIISTAAYDGIISYEGDDTIVIEDNSQVLGDNQQSAESTAAAAVTAVDAGSGDDRVTNNGSIGANAGADATAVGVALTISGGLEGDIEGKALSDSSATADATAIGIDGGLGLDVITNPGTIIGNANARTTGAGVAVDIEITKEGNATGAALSDASVRATAAATAIDGGDDADAIDNRGDIGLSADAEATGVSVSLDVAGTMQGDAAGSSVSDSSTTATAAAIGIAGGEGDDEIINEAVGTTTNAHAGATGVSVGLTVSGSMKGNVEGQALSDASVTADAAATGIDGGSGQDRIDNWSKLSSAVDASATGVAASLKVGFTKEGDVSPDAVAEGAALSDASVTATAAATGIDGGQGDDTIDNGGDIELLGNSEATGVSVSLDVAGTMKGDAAGSSASNASVTATSAAIGIEGGEGDDTIDNEGMISLMNGSGDAETDASATAVSVGLTVTGSMEGNVAGSALSDASALADAKAIGIKGDGGRDEIRNRGAIVANVDAGATAVGVSVTVGLSKEGNATGAALSDASVRATAAATAIDGGDDADAIDNRGDIGLSADAEATGVSVSLDVAGTMQGDAAGSSVSDSSTTATAAAIGIAGGEGDDEIINEAVGTTTNAHAGATGVSVGLTVSGSMKGNVEGQALSDASVTADAAATGIDGGSGQDRIDNWSKLSSAVDASATGVAASLKVGFTKEGDVSPDAVAEGAALSDASVTATAAATGIDGGQGDDTIDNGGDIELLGNSEATGVSVSLDVAGTMKGDAAGSSASNASVTATSAAIGIEGGEGDDTIDNEGMISLMNGSGDAETDASATAVSVGLTVTGSMEGNVAGSALSDASALADAKAIGIKGDGGRDEIRNRGAIVANVDAGATAVGVGLDVNIIIAKEGDVEGNVSGAALSDASVTANAAVAGIDGGGDGDAIDNRADMDLSASSDATGVAASIAVAGSVAMKGGVEGEIGGKALSNASTEAYAETAGIDGDEGSDRIINTGDFNLLQAESKSTGVSASLNVSAGLAANGDAKVNVTGEAVSDASVTAEARTSAISGGSGEDNIINAGDFVHMKSDSEAVSVAASLDITGAIAFKGDADASTSGSAVSAASANALTTTVAIDGGVGNDIINNTGNIINLESDSTATSVSAGANVSAVVTIKGNAEADVTGEAVGDSRVISRAIALGLDGGLGDDEIDNEGDINLLSTADATGVAAELNVSAALSFKGVSTADVSGTAASNSSVSAKAEATGIEGGWGQDTIRNSGDITLMNADRFDADALGVSASLNVSGNVAIKGVAAGTVEGAAASNATVTAEAAATGIDGGGDNDIIGNTGAIKLLPSSNAEGIAASLNVSGNMVGETEGSAMSDASVVAISTATGIDAGDGADIIANDGAITLMKQEGGEQTDANALGVAATLDITGNLNGTAEGQALSKTTTKAGATATGIDGGRGTDEITNTAVIAADVDSQALGVAASLGISIGLNGSAEGAALSDASVTAEAAATGIDGGEGADTIANERKEGSERGGDIELSATADAESVAVSVGITGSMRGTAEGKTVADSSAKASSTATGLDGGSGEDDITNAANISASVDSYATAIGVSADFTVAVNGMAEGAALSDVSAESFSSAIGIYGADDHDTIDNTGFLDIYSFSDSETTAVSVSLTGTMGGVAEGKAASDGSAKALSKSTGIDGGQGDDVISNSNNKITTFSHAISDTTSVSVQGGGSIGLAKGASVANASSISEVYSTGIDGGQGEDTIENNSEIKSTARANAEASATSVGVTIGVGSAGTIGTGDSSATATANAIGIEGGGEGDKITNTGAITVGGFDNLGLMANAQAGATTVTVGLAAGLNTSKASSIAAAIAEANAAGISGGSGNDVIDNTGDITVGPDSLGTGSMADASATSTTVDISVTVGASLGESSSDTSSTAVANLAGISGGAGNDTVSNSGTIITGTDPDEPGKTDAMATANAASETVDVDITVGGSFSDASSNASATAQSTSTGIETDTGNDRIDNTGVINAFSSSKAVGLGKTTTASLTVGASEGNAQSNASSLSTALATGIDSGGNSDEISTDSDVVVKARAISTTLSEATNYNILSVGSALQSADANSSSTAEAIARGIDGGTGADTITAAGNYAVSADTQVYSTSRSSTVTGLSIGYNVQEAQSRAGTFSDAVAVGIDGGEGHDVINSTAALTVNTTSIAVTRATSSSNTGFNIAGSSSGEAVADATTDVSASGIGIRGGISVLDVNQSDADVITNEGLISVTTLVTADTNSTSTADSITFIGEAEGTAVSNASAKVLADGIGIDGGADNDTITSKKMITVKTTADASVTSTSEVDSYATFGGASSMGVSDASANVLAEATGISGGSGDDVITGLAPVTVEAESIGSVTANSYVDAAVTFGGASSKAASDASATKKAIARGIDGGDGDDVITNYDDLRVTAISAGTVTSESRAKAKATFGSSRSLTTTAAALEGAVDTKGIIGGSGADTIKNFGRVDSIADATLYVKNSSVATAKSTFGSSDARAFSVSTAQGKASAAGISGDDGKDIIDNEGVVNASAIANTEIKSATVAIARSTFGGEFTVAASTNYAAGESTSTGITAGAGDDKIVNKQLVTVETGGTVKLDSLTVSSDGPAYSNAGTIALANSRGVDGGAGDDDVLNSNTVFVKTKPRILSAARTFGSGGNVDGKVGILLNATAAGIAGGEGNDAINNAGNVLVLAGVQETGSTLSEDEVGGSTTITDKSFTALGNPQDLAGKWIRITGGGNPDFFTQVVAFDQTTGEFTLRDALKYDLPTGTAYTLYDYGIKEPDITSLNVTVGGRTRVDASTTASVQAKGIVGGDGDDQIVNAGTTAVSASSLVKTVTVNVTRNIRADTRIDSSVDAAGIEGNDRSSVTDVSDGGTNLFTDLSRKGEDPDAIVGKSLLFKSGSSADFATRVVEFDPDTGTFTLADPLPAGGLMRGDTYTLGGGSDSITNLGEIDVRADSAIDASSWSLSFGSADIAAVGRAQALSAGIRGGEFNDFLENYGNVWTRSTADVSSTERVLVGFGSADQKLVFEAASNSVGVDAGAGDDRFINAENNSINAEAASTADVNGVTTTVLAEVKNSVNAIADATVLGLDLGQGNNVAYNEGEFRVSAGAITNAQAISEKVYIPLFGFLNETNADADALAKASAWGIRAGSGEDQVFNHNLIQVDAAADASSFAQGSKVGDQDDTSTVTGDSNEGSKTFVDASLIPAEGQAPPDLVGKWVRFLSGENVDFFTRIVGFDPSTGTITILDELPGDLKAAVLDEDGEVITPADGYTFSAARNGTSASVASALATGIDGGDGNAIVENVGVLRVKASAKADTTARTYGGQATAEANSSAEARGIRTGTGDDVIRNTGVIDAGSEVVTTISGGSATEIATATGIDAGDGNNQIANEGEINVSASVAQPNGEARARGIITGEGDDTIINSGKIITATVANGTEKPGIGIATGGGNDHVTLARGTLVEGSINLGEGNDTLAFQGSPVVSGEVTGESGIDALIFDGAGSFGSVLSDFESATKREPGTFTVASLTTVQRVEVDQGTMEIDDDYQLAAGGTFQTKIYGGGDSGQLKINGEAGLAGTLKVVRGPGAYVSGTKYDVLVADKTTDWFSDEIMPEPTALVSFRAKGYPDRVEVEPVVKSFTTVANNRLHRTIARYMDRILPSASGDLSNVLGEFQNLSGTQFNTAFSGLSPDSYNNSTSTSLNETQQYVKTIQQRMHSLRASLNFAAADTRPKYGAWLQGFGQRGDQDSDDGYTGYDFDLYGGTLGADRFLTDQVLLGVSLGVSRADIDFDNNMGDSGIDAFIGSLYGSWFTKNYYLDASLSYGYQEYNNNRNITIGAIHRNANSDHDGSIFSGYLEGGYNFSFGRWMLGPYATMNYLYLDEDGFTESGAGSLDLSVDDRQTDALFSQLGAVVAGRLSYENFEVMPELRLAWQHDFDIDDQVVTSSFAGAPGVKFSIDGQNIERNSLVAEVGATLFHKNGLSVPIKYSAEFRDDYTAHGVLGLIRYEF